MIRTRLLLALALAAATTIFGTNVAQAGHIAYGVQTVVIDAGHGGKFPGAHYAGVYEKDLTLKVALKLGRLIEQRMPGVKVVYTRKTDKALAADLAGDLQARADIANKAGGDLFLSIHVNAARSSAARGVETLVMGESPKEQRYNENALFANNREDLIDMSDERTAAIVRAYIQNLQFTYGEYSMAMARCIQNNYLKTGRHSRGIKPQLLRVLYATDMPGVLTEIGFLSNAQEAAYMKSEKGQNEIAEALFRAVKDYSDYVLSTRQAGEEETGSGEKDDATPAETKETPAETKDKAAETATAADTTPSEHYAVQVLAAAEEVPVGSTRFKSYRGKVTCYTATGKLRFKYCIGSWPTRAEAQKQLAEIRKTFPDAFVVRCKGTEIAQ